MKKKVLITGGATWIKIDEVRIFTNIFTGKTALGVARDFRNKGWDVTLLINPHCIEKFPDGITRFPFQYFSGLKRLLETLLKKDYYDIIIHSAAVSDYQLKKPVKGKFPSKRTSWILKLVPTEKLISLIRKKSPKSFLVQFKLEYGRQELKKKALRSLRQNRCDLIVANAYIDLTRGYKALILDPTGTTTPIVSKTALVPTILKYYSQRTGHIDTRLI
ncbi:MAG: hypothetical protein JXD21_08150 [Candidatus Omnitrophica bacterium]|nr:hypothetical protein [Candidatus Omnitrophota bacterium]